MIKIEFTEKEKRYPINELYPIILFSMGLLLLGGYVWLKKGRGAGSER